MPPKPPVWADILLTIWVVWVAIFFWGGYLNPALGDRSTQASAYYAILLLVSAVWAVARRGRRAPPDGGE